MMKFCKCGKTAARMKETEIGADGEPQATFALVPYGKYRNVYET